MTFQGKYTSYLLPQVGLSRKVIYGLSRKADFDMEVWLQVLLVGGRGFWINTPERRGWKHKCTEKLNLPTDLHPQQSNTLVKKKKKVDANCLYEVLSWPHCGAGSRRPGARMVLQSCSSLEWRSWAFFTSAVTSDCVQQTVPEGGLTLGKAVSLAEVIPARADSSLRQQLGV